MCVIIRSSASASASGAPVATAGSLPLTYEQQRAKNIQTNNDKLRELGIGNLKIGGGEDRQKELEGSGSDSDDSYHPSSNDGDDDEDDA